MTLKFDKSIRGGRNGGGGLWTNKALLTPRSSPNYQFNPQQTSSWFKQLSPRNSEIVGIRQRRKIGENFAVQKLSRRRGETCVWDFINDLHELRTVGEDKPQKNNSGHTSPFVAYWMGISLTVGALDLPYPTFLHDRLLRVCLVSFQCPFGTILL